MGQFLALKNWELKWLMGNHQSQKALGAELNIPNYPDLNKANQHVVSERVLGENF